MEDKEDHSSFFAEGAYGCVMYPRIDCFGHRKKITTTDHVKKEMSKIVKNDFTAENEIILGKKINKINKKTKKMLFLPVTRFCSIHREKIQNYRQCQLLSNDKNKHVHKFKILYSTYLESKTIHDHLFQEISFSSQAHLDKMTSYFCFMVLALKILHESGVLHNDLNPKNVLVSKNKKMHIIDFGRSIMTSKIYFKNSRLNMEYLKHFFSIWNPTRFFYWPIEHYILSFFIKEERSIDSKSLIQIIEKYYDNEKNKPLYIANEKQRHDYIKTIYEHYKEKFVNFIPYKDHIQDIINNASKTWDLYAVCYLCFKFMILNKNNSQLSKLRWFSYHLNDAIHYDYMLRPSISMHEEVSKKLNNTR